MPPGHAPVRVPEDQGWYQEYIEQIGGSPRAGGHHAFCSCVAHVRMFFLPVEEKIIKYCGLSLVSGDGLLYSHVGSKSHHCASGGFRRLSLQPSQFSPEAQK